MTDEAQPDPRIGKRLIAETRLKRNELKIERAIKKALEAQKKKTMASISTMVVTASSPPDPFDVASWDDEVNIHLESVVDEVFSSLAQGVTGFLSLPAELRAEILGVIDVSSRVQEFMDLVRTVGPEVQEALLNTVHIGTMKGESVAQLTKRVDDAYGIGFRNAQRIVRTEVHGASEATTYAAANGISSAGESVYGEWVAARDSRTRKTHLAADGQIVKLGEEKFKVGGHECDHPGNTGVAAEDINCRCSVAYSLGAPAQSGRAYDVPLVSKAPADHVQTDGGKSIHKADAAAKMYGVGSKQHVEAVKRFGEGSVPVTDPLDLPSRSSVTAGWQRLTESGRYSQKRAKQLRDDLTAEGHGAFVEAIKGWQFGETDKIHRELKTMLTGGKATDRAQAIVDGIREAPAEAPVIFRGTFLPGKLENVQAGFAKGSEFDLAPKSFTTEPSVGLLFAGQQAGAKSGTKIMYQMAQKSKAIPVENLSETKALYTEKEWISGGRYKILDTYTIPDPEKPKKNVLVVQIQQIGVH